MVVAVGLTLTEVPVPIAVPPQDPLYHFQLAWKPSVPPLTVRVTVLPPQVVSLLAVMPVGATDLLFTLMVLLAQAVVLHSPSARTQ